MERRYNQGFWLKDNAITEGTIMINEGHSNLTFDATSGGSDNRLDVLIANGDKNFDYTGVLYISFFMRDGYMTEWSE